MSQSSRNRGVLATVVGAELLHKERLSLNLTYETLSNRAGVSVDAVKRLLKRTQKVDLDTVRRVVSALGLQPTDVIDPNDWERPPKTLDQSPIDILLSYHDDATHVAQEISAAIQELGHNVFLAGNDARKPPNWSKALCKALESCRCYVLLLSARSAVSEMITEEVRQVKERCSPHAQTTPNILPIYLDVNLRLNPDLQAYLLGGVRWLWRSSIDRPAILQALTALLNGQAPEKPIPEPDEPLVDNLLAQEELPGGQVPLNSAFYVDRPPIEDQCYSEILYPGALIRIKAPRQMGKTSLMARILSKAREQGYRTVALSFQSATSSVLRDLEKLMQWFCGCIAKKLHLPNRLAEHWDDIFDANYNCTTYFESYLLPDSDMPLVIGLDEVDRIFAYSEVASDFLALLRAWYEKSRYGDQDSDLWKKLRIVMVHSTEVYIPMNLNQSPFNVGLSIELPEFDQAQVQDLAHRYGLNWRTPEVEGLMSLVGGHPHLIRLALHHIAHQTVALKPFLDAAATDAGIYQDHLRRQWWNLEQNPDLAAAFHKVVTAKDAVQLKSVLAFKLYSLGLVRIEGNQVMPRCDLYRQYFCRQLVD